MTAVRTKRTYTLTGPRTVPDMQAVFGKCQHLWLLLLLLLLLILLLRPFRLWCAEPVVSKTCKNLNFNNVILSSWSRKRDSKSPFLCDPGNMSTGVLCQLGLCFLHETSWPGKQMSRPSESSTCRKGHKHMFVIILNALFHTMFILLMIDNGTKRTRVWILET